MCMNLGEGICHQRFMRVLVTGGAGYVGAHIVRVLRGAGHAVVVIDTLAQGTREHVPRDVPLVQVDLLDTAGVAHHVKHWAIEAVVHCAALTSVAESVAAPGRFYEGNLVASLSLLDACVASGVKTMVLSSTAAVYGPPETIPIREAHPLRPMNPYGETKLAVERMLRAYSEAHGLQYVALRYFNAAGAARGSALAERHHPETHLIPLALGVAAGAASSLNLYGDMHDTPDGTCIRDYVHVEDLARAHVLSLGYLRSGGESICVNLGTGRGHSVRDVVRTCERVTGAAIPLHVQPPRKGDPAVLVADASLAKRVLGWSAEHDLERMVEDAWLSLPELRLGDGSAWNKTA